MIRTCFKNIPRISHRSKTLRSHQEHPLDLLYQTRSTDSLSSRSHHLKFCRWIKRGQKRIFTPTYVGGGWGAPGPQSRNFDEKNGICPKSRWMYQKAAQYTQKAAGYTQNRAVEAHPHPLTPGGCVVWGPNKYVFAPSWFLYNFLLCRSGSQKGRKLFLYVNAEIGISAFTALQSKMFFYGEQF